MPENISSKRVPVGPQGFDGACEKKQTQDTVTLNDTRDTVTRRHGHLSDVVGTKENFKVAHYCASRRKKRRKEVKAFESNLDENAESLLQLFLVFLALFLIIGNHWDTKFKEFVTDNMILVYQRII